MIVSCHESHFGNGAAFVSAWHKRARNHGDGLLTTGGGGDCGAEAPIDSPWSHHAKEQSQSLVVDPFHHLDQTGPLREGNKQRRHLSVTGLTRNAVQFIWNLFSVRLDAGKWVELVGKYGNVRSVWKISTEYFPRSPE